MYDSILPRHVAIIMDGNGRWAKQHAFSVMMGHRQGVETLREIIRFSSTIGLQVLSLYAFSTENWSRPQTEVEALMRLIVEFFQSEIEELNQNKVRIRILGNKEALPAGAKQAVAAAEKRTDGNSGMQLNIALNYGAREEILRAVRMIVQEVLEGSLPKEAINWDEFWMVVNGNGPCNQQRIDHHIKAHQEGEWVRKTAIEAELKHQTN